MKRQISASVDEYLHQLAKDRGLNVSEVLERALAAKLNPQNEINNDTDKCEYCGAVMKKATAFDTWGLMFVLPDEKWICPKCLRGFTEEILKTKS